MVHHYLQNPGGGVQMWYIYIYIEIYIYIYIYIHEHSDYTFVIIYLYVFKRLRDGFAHTGTGHSIIRTHHFFPYYFSIFSYI